MLMSLATLSSKSQAIVANRQTRLADSKRDVKDIVLDYKAGADITPEHMAQGVKAGLNIGRIYGAWYIHKSKIDATALNVAFISKHYNRIVVKDDASAMADELARVANLVKDEEATKSRADLMAGTAFRNTVEDLNKALVKAASVLAVPSAVNDALVMTLKVNADALLAKYNAAVALVQQEEESKQTVSA